MALDRMQMLRRRHQRVRQKIHGTAERPRLCIHKSSRHLYAQLIDDDAHRTLAFVTTNRKSVRESDGKKTFSNARWAKQLGAEMGGKAKEIGVASVVFDRGGYPYHGCVKIFAESAREAGLKF